MNTEKRHILYELKARLEKVYPGIVRKTVLYGSQVKGEAREGSDYDILVIMGADVDWKMKHCIQDIAYDIDLQHKILLDVTVISEKEMRTIKGRQPFIQEAMTHGIAA